MPIHLMDKKISEDNYEEYVDKVVNIFRLSSKNSSIVYRLKIENNKAIIKLSIINQMGANQEYSDQVMNCNEKFYQNFLIPLIEKINDNVEIRVKDVVNLDGDEFHTLRMITENNDLFAIDGLKPEDAKSFLERIDKGKEIKPLIVPNNEGKGNIWIFLLMIVTAIVAFIMIILL